jgi:glycosyltransferase involved in cell wall biosynthesis
MASELAVLMAAYKSEATIQKAVSSLTGSTYSCDIYVVDDGSPLPVADVLGQIPNVEIIRLAQNQGPARASNAGLERIFERGYKYIAKMDADDISHPERFAKQIKFLECHPDIGAVGTWGRHFSETTGDTVLINRTPVTSDAVRKKLFFNSAIINASVLIRADVLHAIGPYSVDYPAAEDYELYRRISTRYSLANIPEILIDIRESVRGISFSRRRQQVYDRLRIQIKYFEPLQWRAWLGVAMSLVMLIVPRKVTAALKLFLRHD